MSVTSQAAIHALLDAARRALEACVDDSIALRPSLPAEIVAFSKPGCRIVMTIDLSVANAAIGAEIVRTAESGVAEAMVLFEMASSPPDGIEKVLH